MTWLLQPITALGRVFLSADAHPGVVYPAIQQWSNSWRLACDVTNDLATRNDSFLVLDAVATSRGDR